MPLFLPPSSNLAFPAGRAPGFNPSHPASKGISARHGYSGVVQPGGALLNLLKGTQDSPIGTPLPLGVDANVGAVVRGTAASYFSLPGNAAVVDTKVTVAGIFRYKTIGSDQPIFASTATAHSGIDFFVGAANALKAYSSSIIITSPFTLNSNEAYFVAFSDNNIISNFVAISLQTGKRFTSSDASTALSVAPDGSYMVCKDGFASVTTFPVAAVSFTPSYLSMPELLAWASDPWAFWYPNKKTYLSDGIVFLYLRPDADSIDGSWTNESGGTSLFASIDESSANDADYIRSSINPVADIAKISFANPSTAVAAPVKISYRYKKDSATTADLTVRLLQGVTEIASWTHTGISTTYVTTQQTLTAPQFASITDFTDLYLVLEANS